MPLLSSSPPLPPPAVLNSWRWPLLILPILVTLCLTALPADAHAQPAAPAATTRDASELETVRRAYEQAFLEQRSFDSAGNLGDVELKLGLLDQAATHLSFALEHFPADGSAELRAALEQRLGEARSGGGTAAATVAGPAPAAASADEASDSGPSPVLITVGAGLTLAAAAVGAAMAAVSAARHDVAFQRGSALEELALPDPCGSYPKVCEQIRGEQDQRDTFGAAAGVAFGVAGAAAIGTVLYALLATDEPPEDSPAAASLQPALGPDAAGLGVRLRW